MSVTIPVDRVAPATEPASDRPIAQVFGEVIGRPVVTCTDVDVRLVTPTPIHPFAAAVQLAFTEHRPLILSPDAVWLTIAQGFARHVNHNHEQLRKRFVRHSGIKTINADVSSLRTHLDWARTVDRLCASLTQDLEPGLGESLRCDFSTTTSTTRVASDIVLLDTFQRYFKYEALFVCGIPQVTLLGTEEDWRKIEARIEVLGQYDLEWWTDRLVPVCRELRRTAEGDPDPDFWQSIYMPEEVYGGEHVTGWIVRFFPYLEIPEDEPIEPSFDAIFEAGLVGSTLQKNDAIEPWEPAPEDTWGIPRGPDELPPERRRCWLCRGMGMTHLPLGLSKVPVRIRDTEGARLTDVQLVAGFIGVSQSPSLAVQPHIGWGVIEGDVEEPFVSS